MTTRPPIPPDVARTLRQEARFGCCRCGNPIFEYHHIVEWSEDHHFRPEDMMILCPNCHHAAGHGGFSLEKQRKFKAHPHNVKRGYAAGLLNLDGNLPPIVKLGGNIFVNEGTLLAFGGERVLGMSIGPDGDLELSLVLNNAQDQTQAVIEKNEWISGDPTVWDIEAGHRRLLLRNRKGKIALKIDARRFPVEIHANLWSQGRQISIAPSSLGFGGRQVSIRFVNMTFSGSYFSLDKFVEAQDGGPSIELRQVPDERYGPGQLCAGTDAATVQAALDHFMGTAASRRESV